MDLSRLSSAEDGNPVAGAGLLGGAGGQEVSAETSSALGGTSSVLLLAGLFGTIAVALALLCVRRLAMLPAPTHVPWWLLAAGFAAADAVPIHLDIRRQTHSFSVIELPLVIGLLFASPLGVVAA